LLIAALGAGDAHHGTGPMCSGRNTGPVGGRHGRSDVNAACVRDEGVADDGAGQTGCSNGQSDYVGVQVVRGWSHDTSIAKRRCSRTDVEVMHEKFTVTCGRIFGQMQCCAECGVCQLGGTGHRGNPMKRKTAPANRAPPYASMNAAMKKFCSKEGEDGRWYVCDQCDKRCSTSVSPSPDMVAYDSNYVRVLLRCDVASLLKLALVDVGAVIKERWSGYHHCRLSPVPIVGPLIGSRQVGNGAALQEIMRLLLHPDGNSFVRKYLTLHERPGRDLYFCTPVCVFALVLLIMLDAV